MIRFAFTFALFLLVIGCQSAAPGPKSSVMVHSPPPGIPAKTFWNQAAKLFRPLMPDTGGSSIEAENHFALHRSDILPIQHTSHSLYNAGSIFPSPRLLSLEEEEPIFVTETVPKPDRPLAEVAETSCNLPQDTMAPLPGEELLTEKRTVARNNPLRRQPIEPEPDEDEDYDFDFDEEPLLRQVANRTATRNEEPASRQESASPPAPVYPHLTQLPGATVPSDPPTMVQASYQQSMPPYAHSVSVGGVSGNRVSGYGAPGYGAGDWQTPARQTIEQLRYAIEQTPSGRTLSNEMRLRVLEMLLGNKTEAAKPMQSADKTVNAFMGNQVLGFAALLDDSMPDNRGRYVSAAFRFSEGLLELQNLCPFKLKNVMFVDDWVNYGQFIPRTRDFHPGESFSVYLELDNPTVRRTVDGFEVAVSISYEIRDSRANVVAKMNIGPAVDRTLSRKRDYGLGFPGSLPTSLAPGQYQLRVSVTDMNDDSMQYAEEQIPLKIVPLLAGE